MVRVRYARRNDARAVAVVDERIVGYALIYPGYDPGEGSPGLHLQDLIVATEHRRHGVGRALMDAVTAAARKIDARWITWFARPSNQGARAFYRKLGAKRLESLPLYVDVDVARRSTGRHKT